MKTVFADTFYWIALSDPSDARYKDALAVENTLVGAKILTTEEVLSEFLTFFAADPRWRARASRAVGALFGAPDVHIFRQSHESFPLRSRPLCQSPRQGLQSHRLHLHANHAPGKHS